MTRHIVRRPPLPDPTGSVMLCLKCPPDRPGWQIDAPPAARRDLGVDGLRVALAEAAVEHEQEEHPETVDQPVILNGQVLRMADGRPARGGLGGWALPRWWDWITTKGTR